MENRKWKLGGLWASVVSLHFCRAGNFLREIPHGDGAVEELARLFIVSRSLAVYC